MFPFSYISKQGDSLSPLLFKFALEYVIRRVQVNQDGFKLNSTLQLLVNADDANMLCDSVHVIKKNTEALLVGSTEIGLEVSVDKTMYMVMSRDQNAGRNHGIKFDNISFKNVEDFKYFGTILNKNAVQEEIKSRLQSQNTRHHSLLTEYMSSFVAESFVFWFSIQKHKD
jgi:hypothetical protein